MSGLEGKGEPLDQLTDALSEARQVPKVEKIVRRTKRWGQMTMIGCLLLTLFSIGWNAWTSNAVAQNSAQQTVNENDIKDLREANKLRVAAGLTEIPLPKPGEPVDMSAVVAAASALALDSIRDDPRFRGDTGASGQPGEPCAPQVPGCTGPEGKAGTDGSRGQDGAAGQNGRSISMARIDDNGDLWLEFDDQYPSINVGKVRVGGPAGPSGVNGSDGVSIDNVEIQGSEAGCSLVVGLSNGTARVTSISPAICEGV